MTTDTADEITGTTRRAVLAGAATAVAVTAVAGCGTRGGPASRTAKPAAPIALGPVADIPVGGGTVFADQRVVVTQPIKGTIKCFTAICTHAGCTVGDVSGGTINCRCHGSRYRITDGTVVNGPAPRPLAAQPFTVADGTVTLD